MSGFGKEGDTPLRYADHEDEAFEQELKAAPWGYGQPIDIFFVIAQLKRHGLHREAKWLLDEWVILTHR